MDECNSTIQTDIQAYQSEIQKLNSEIENLRAKFNSNQTNQTASALCTSPQTSTTISVKDIGHPTSRGVRVASRGQEIVSVASQGESLKCISCVPRFQPQAYELRPAVSKELHQLHRKICV